MSQEQGFPVLVGNFIAGCITSFITGFFWTSGGILSVVIAQKLFGFHV